MLFHEVHTPPQVQQTTPNLIEWHSKSRSQSWCKRKGLYVQHHGQIHHLPFSNIIDHWVHQNIFFPQAVRPKRAGFHDQVCNALHVETQIGLWQVSTFEHTLPSCGIGYFLKFSCQPSPSIWVLFKNPSQQPDLGFRALGPNHGQIICLSSVHRLSNINNANCELGCTICIIVLHVKEGSNSQRSSILKIEHSRNGIQKQESSSMAFFFVFFFFPRHKNLHCFKIHNYKVLQMFDFVAFLLSFFF